MKLAFRLLLILLPLGGMAQTPQDFFQAEDGIRDA